MKIIEILKESGTGSLAPAVQRTLPGTFEFPKLANQDPYLQYRMGLALASANSGQPLDSASAFGENMSIVAYTDADIEIIELASKLIGQDLTAGSKLITTVKSQESTDVNVTSPIAKCQKNQYGV